MSEINKLLVVDPVLQAPENLNFGVYKGPDSINNIRYSALSNSPNYLSFNLIIPSETTCIDRHVEIETGVVMRVVPPANETMENFMVQYGLSEGLNSFAINRLITNSVVMLNSNNFSLQNRDVVAALCRMSSQEDGAYYNGGTPYNPDNVFNYDDLINSESNIFRAFNGSSNRLNQKRGVKPMSIKVNYTPGGGGVPVVGADFATLDLTVAAIQNGNNITAFFTFDRIVEPLLLSPFLYKNSVNNFALYGVQNAAVQLNIGNADDFYKMSASRWIANAGGVSSSGLRPKYSYSIDSFTDPIINLKCYTPPQELLLPPTCVLPYQNITRFLTTFTTPLVPGTPVTLSSNPIQLSGIPDMIAVYVKPKFGANATLAPNVLSDSFLAIKKISINFNNVSGILSTASQKQLFEMSAQNGSIMTYEEFTGKSNMYRVRNANNSSNTVPLVVPTCGSLLLLRFGKEIPLDTFYSCSSIGNFNFQITVDCELQQNAINPNGNAGVPAQGVNWAGPGSIQRDPAYPGYGVNALVPELYLLTFESGFVSTSRGVTSSYVNVLDKNSVVKALEEKRVYTQSTSRVYGGSWWDTIRNGISNYVVPAAKLAVKAAPLFGLGKEGEEGEGMSAAGMSAAGRKKGGMHNGLLKRLK